MAKENEKIKKKDYKISYAFMAALLTIPIVLLIFFLTERLPGQKWIFLEYDMRPQYATFAELLWRSILSGEGIGYTFHVSLGIPSIPLYTYYSLSPFNLLYVLIGHTELASLILVALKLSLAAYTFQRFSARVLKNDSLSSVIFAVGYALNGYCIIFYTNIIFLDGVYMLPLIAMLISEAVKEKRFIRLALAYAYLFVVQFYEGYIIGFFSLLYFILLIITEYKKEWKRYITALVGFGVSAVVAALIGAAFLYPTAIFMMGNMSTQNIDSWHLPVQIWDICRNLYIGHCQGIQSPYPYIYCGIMSLYLVPCFFADRRILNKDKLIVIVLLGYLLICSLWTPGYLFMHCFDYPNGTGFRFSYFYPFVFLAIGCAEWKYMDSKRTWKLIVLLMIQIAAYFILNIGGEGVTVPDKISNVVFLIIFAVLFILFRKHGAEKLFQGVFLGAVCIELIIHGVLSIGKFEMAWTQPRGIYQAFTTINRQAVDEITAYDSSFYRIAQENIYDPNDSAANGYYGLNYFSTVENDRMRQTLGILGYANSESIAGDVGGTALTRMLLAQKYEIIANNLEYIRGNTDQLWTRNERALSLGYMVSDELLDVVLVNGDAFENQNSLASGMTGEDISLFVPYPGEITGVIDDMLVYSDDSLPVIGLEPPEGVTEGSVTFRMDDTGAPVYGYFSQDNSIWVNESVYFESGEEYKARLWIPPDISMPQIIELDKDDEGRYYVGLYYDETHSNHNYYKDSYFYCYDDTAVDRVYDLLKDHQMNILEMKGSDITAEIEVPADRHILFTSIPYDDGWHVLVDGEEAETIAVVNETFLAVELTEGYHKLQFYYSSDTDRTGMIISIAGIIIYALMVWMDHIKKKNMRDGVKDSDEVQGVI